MGWPLQIPQSLATLMLAPVMNAASRMDKCATSDPTSSSAPHDSGANSAEPADDHRSLFFQRPPDKLAGFGALDLKCLRDCSWKWADPSTRAICPQWLKLPSNSCYPPLRTPVGHY